MALARVGIAGLLVFVACLIVGHSTAAPSTTQLVAVAPVTTTTVTVAPTTIPPPPPVVHASRGEAHRSVIRAGHLPAWTNDPFDALSACEAGMNPTRVNASGKFRGAFQFSLATWHGIGEAGDPINFDYAHQKAAAERLQARSGWRQWPQCAKQLGLI